MRNLITLGAGLGLAWLAAASPVRAKDEPNVFGSKDNTDAGLIGIIYDLKQDQKRQRTHVTAESYIDIVKEFLRSGWDESVLNRYFRASRPLYSTQVFIPLMSANEAPKAFEVEEIMKPSAWLVHYKGQVSPPEDGRYRFLCYSDDFIAVRVNGETVYAGGRIRIEDDIWPEVKEPNAGQAGNGSLHFGSWVPMKKGEPIDLDVLVGERPGGQFCAFLLYEREGFDYPEQNGRTLYPVFQLTPYAMPQRDPHSAPPFYEAKETWTAHP